MSYFRRSGIFARTNNSTVSFSPATTGTIELNNSVIRGSEFDGTYLTSRSNTILAQCDIRYYYNGSWVSYSQSYFSGHSPIDYGRQLGPSMGGGLHARDEFWGLGSSLRPVGTSGGGAGTGMFIYQNYVLVIGLVL